MPIHNDMYIHSGRKRINKYDLHIRVYTVVCVETKDHCYDVLIELKHLKCFQK